MALIKAGEFYIACGSLPRDAEFKRVGDKKTPLCKFGIKAGERKTDDGNEAIWVNCTCWRDVAKATAGLQKGDVVFAIGTMQSREYTGRDGELKTSKELVCEFVAMMANEKRQSETYFAEPIPAEPISDFAELPEDTGELPF